MFRKTNMAVETKVLVTMSCCRSSLEVAVDRNIQLFTCISSGFFFCDCTYNSQARDLCILHSLFVILLLLKTYSDSFFSFFSIFVKVQVSKVKTISPHWDFVGAPCEYASYCGGCKTQNLSYEAQVRAKEQQVCELVIHVGKFSSKELESLNVMKPIVPCDIQFHYRNKVSTECTTCQFGCFKFGRMQ